jgi:hypothetical protein
VAGPSPFRYGAFCFQHDPTCWLNWIAERPLNTEEHEVFNLYEAEAIRVEKAKLLAAETALETIKSQNRREEERRAQERARQPVSRSQVREAFDKWKIKSDGGIRKICRQHGVEWPKTQRELDSLLRKHERRKRTVGEAVGRRNKARAQERRKGAEKDF